MCPNIAHVAGDECFVVTLIVVKVQYSAHPGSMGRSWSPARHWQRNRPLLARKPLWTQTAVILVAVLVGFSSLSIHYYKSYTVISKGFGYNHDSPCSILSTAFAFVNLYSFFPIVTSVIVPLVNSPPSDRQHPSYDGCLEVRGEIIRAGLCCIVYWSCAQS